MMLDGVFLENEREKMCIHGSRTRVAYFLPDASRPHPSIFHQETSFSGKRVTEYSYTTRAFTTRQPTHIIQYS
jgi:hypothetical protein